MEGGEVGQENETMALGNTETGEGGKVGQHRAGERGEAGEGVGGEEEVGEAGVGQLVCGLGVGEAAGAQTELCQLW